MSTFIDTDSDAVGPDGPDAEPGEILADEVERVVEHPLAEARRLTAVADEGSSGATPWITLAGLAAAVVPLALITVAIVLAIYFWL